MKRKLFCLLTLLLTVCSGAWADDAVTATQTITNSNKTCTWTNLSIAVAKNKTAEGNGLVVTAKNGAATTTDGVTKVKTDSEIYVEVPTGATGTIKVWGMANNKSFTLNSSETTLTFTDKSNIVEKSQSFVADDIATAGGVTGIKLVAGGEISFNKIEVVLTTGTYSGGGSSTYSVTHTLSNVTATSGATGAGAATEGSNYTAVFAANSNYKLPDAITVTIGGETKTVDTDYTWNKSTGTVTIPAANVTGAIVITVTGVALETYSVTHTLSNVTATSGATGAGAATEGSNYTAVFAANSNYKLPDAITVTIGGETKTVDTDYTWNKSTGTVTIPAANVTGAIVITVTGVALEKYSVTHTLSNVTTSSGATGANAATEGSDYTAVFAASSGYNLPESITVTAGGSDITANCTWTKATGTVVVPAAYVTGNLVITVTGVAVVLGGNVTFDYDLDKTEKNKYALWAIDPITLTTNATKTDSNGFISPTTVTLTGSNALITNVVITYQANNRKPTTITANDETSLDRGETTDTWTNTNGKQSIVFTLGSAPRLTKIEVTYSEAVAVTGNAYNWITFCNGSALDFTGSDVTAYVVTGTSGTALDKTEVTAVAAGTPLMINATEGTHYVKKAATGTDYNENCLKRGEGAAVGAVGGKSRYILTLRDEKAAFAIIDNEYSPTVPSDKAYLEIGGGGAARSFFFLDDEGETTSLNEVRGLKADVRGEFYNLNGQRVAQPSKGLYIVNGRKVVIK